MDTENTTLQLLFSNQAPAPRFANYHGLLLWLFVLHNRKEARVQWLTPIIPATHEA
jgi:hypothetical protein